MVWVDSETTGLDHLGLGASILEIGIVVTDELGLVVEDGIFESLIASPLGATPRYENDYVRKMHEGNGIDEALRAGGLPERWDVEAEAVAFLHRHGLGDLHDRKLPMVGSSIGFDRRWIEHHMPLLGEQFHYRNIDISTLYELAKMLNPEIAHRPEDEVIGAHRVIPDLIDSIELYKHYLAEFLWTKDNAEAVGPFRSELLGRDK